MESVSDEAVKAAIRSALYDVKAGDAFTAGGLEEDDFERIQKGEDDATVNKFFKFVAKRLGPSVSPTKKNKASRQVREMLQSNREKWIKEIQAMSEKDLEALEGKTTFVDESGAKNTNAVDMDVDEGIKVDTDTPRKPKVEDSVESALVTGDTSSAAHPGDSKKEPSDMKVEEAVEVKSESRDSKPEADDDEDTEKVVVKEKANEEEKQESASTDAPNSDGTVETQPPGMDVDAPNSDGTVETQPAGMDVDEAVKKETEKPQKSSKKRKKSQVDGDKKTSRKKTRRKKDDSTRKKKKGGRKKSGPSSAQIEATRDKLKKEVEEEKAEILEELPEDYKNYWGQVGYAKWSKDWLPCMVVGPFDVNALSSVREQWMKMFENTAGRRHQMTYMVYWYGQADPDNAFSFLTKKSITLYEEGRKKGYHKLPAKIQKKMDADKKLTKPEKELIKAHQELEADLLKQPEERRVFDEVQELYENENYIRTMLTGEDADSGDELISSDDDDDDDLLSSDSSSSELESDSDEDEKPAASKVKKTKKKADKKPAVEPMEEDELSFAEDEASSDDSKDEDALLSDESSSEDEADDDYIVAERGGKKKKESAKSKKDRKPKVSKEGKKRGRPPKEKKEKKEPSLYALKRREQKTLRENEDQFLPILEEWKASIKNKDVGSIDRILQKMLRNVDSMGAPFMEAYSVAPLMKTTKAFLRDNNADTSTHKTLLKTLGELHATKKAQVPEGFKPKLRKTVQRKKTKKTGKSGRAKPKKEDLEAAEPPSRERHESTSSLPGSLPSSQSSAGTTSPVRRVQSQGSSTPRPRDSQSVSSPKPEGTKSAAQKSEKTSFSLNRLFNPKPASSSQTKLDGGANAERQPCQSVATAKSLPSWMTSAPANDGDKLSLPSEEVDRLLALEFFQHTASRFPEEKVNREAIARALEAAVYQWSLEQYKKEETYWPKLHAVVAGICGKRKPGSLAAAILAGEYESARDVVTLSDEMLLHSFEGS